MLVAEDGKSALYIRESEREKEELQRQKQISTSVEAEDHAIATRSTGSIQSSDAASSDMSSKIKLIIQEREKNDTLQAQAGAAGQTSSSLLQRAGNKLELMRRGNEEAKENENSRSSGFVMSAGRRESACSNSSSSCSSAANLDVGNETADGGVRKVFETAQRSPHQASLSIYNTRSQLREQDVDKTRRIEGHGQGREDTRASAFSQTNPLTVMKTTTFEAEEQNLPTFSAASWRSADHILNDRLSSDPREFVEIDATENASSRQESTGDVEADSSSTSSQPEDRFGPQYQSLSQRIAARLSSVVPGRLFSTHTSSTRHVLSKRKSGLTELTNMASMHTLHMIQKSYEGLDPETYREHQRAERRQILIEWVAIVAMFGLMAAIFVLPFRDGNIFYLPCCGQQLPTEPVTRCAGRPGFGTSGSAQKECQSPCQVQPNKFCAGGKDHPASPYCSCAWETPVSCLPDGSPPPGAIQLVVATGSDAGSFGGASFCRSCADGWAPNADQTACLYPALCPSGQQSFCGVCHTPFVSSLVDDTDLSTTLSGGTKFGLAIFACSVWLFICGSVAMEGEKLIAELKRWRQERRLGKTKEQELLDEDEILSDVRIDEQDGFINKSGGAAQSRGSVDESFPVGEVITTDSGRETVRSRASSGVWSRFSTWRTRGNRGGKKVGFRERISYVFTFTGKIPTLFSTGGRKKSAAAPRDLLGVMHIDSRSTDDGINEDLLVVKTDSAETMQEHELLQLQLHEPPAGRDSTNSNLQTRKTLTTSTASSRRKSSTVYMPSARPTVLAEADTPEESPRGNTQNEQEVEKEKREQHLLPSQQLPVPHHRISSNKGGAVQAVEHAQSQHQQEVDLALHPVAASSSRSSSAPAQRKSVNRRRTVSMDAPDQNQVSVKKMKSREKRGSRVDREKKDKRDSGLSMEKDMEIACDIALSSVMDAFRVQQSSKKVGRAKSEIIRSLALGPTGPLARNTVLTLNAGAGVGGSGDAATTGRRTRTSVRRSRASHLLMTMPF
ncbi:unnamed protein product [Amoebophrya sp. A25]|nr:unnamed protein product [Amoebophrya sp. A25]|eukprot:GSA25T00006005001.1